MVSPNAFLPLAYAPRLDSFLDMFVSYFVDKSLAEHQVERRFVRAAQHLSNVPIRPTKRERIDHCGLHFGVEIIFRDGGCEVEAIDPTVGCDLGQDVPPNVRDDPSKGW